MASDIKKVILKDDYWKRVSEVVELCTPILKLLRIADSLTPSAGKVHYRASKVAEHLSSRDFNLNKTLINEVRNIWMTRWQMLQSDLYNAAYCLDPEFLGDAALSPDNVEQTNVVALLEMIKKLLPDKDQSAARASYAAFRAREGALFKRSEALEDAEKWPAWQWWETYGAGHPQLQKVAIRILAQVSSACACERNWSSYEHIHSRKRNRLLPARAAKLVAVFTNSKLLEAMKADGGEKFLEWSDGSSEPEEEEEDAAGPSAAAAAAAAGSNE